MGDVIEGTAAGCERVGNATRTRLLNAALSEVARVGPSAVTGGAVARRAHVHLSQIEKTFGSVEDMIRLAVRCARDEHVAATIEPYAANPTSARLPDPLRVADQPMLWRAIMNVIFDPGPIDISDLATGGPSSALADMFHQRHPLHTKAENIALASAWVSAPMGALVFEDVLRTGLELDDDGWTFCWLRLGERLLQLAELDEFPTGRSRQPQTPSATIDEEPPPVGRAATRHALIEAAIDLLGTRLEATVTAGELAAHAGVEKAQITACFGSKYDVFDEAIAVLHARMVDDVVSRDDPRDDRAFAIMRHQVFLRTWASRILGRRLVPDFELTAIRTLDARLAAHRQLDPDDELGRLRVRADALGSLSLQLGWTLLSPLPKSAGAFDSVQIDDELRAINHWFLTAP